ncbi:T9SS type A sorting domain-containing protein [Wenyingzhuangia sp. IMCC45574]
MKKITLIAFALVQFTSFSQNYVNDPTFINPSPATWSVVGSGAETGYDATDTHTADGSGCYVVGPNFNSEIKQTIAAGDTPSGTSVIYTVKYWVKGTAGTQVIFSAFNDGGNVSGTQYTIATTDTWEQVQETFTFNTDTGVTFKLIKKGGNFLSVKFDDVSMEEGNTLSAKNSENTLFSISPTAVSDYLNIQPKTGDLIDKVEIYSILGEKVKTVASTDIRQVSVNELTSGIYLVRAYSKNKNSVTKILKN